MLKSTEERLTRLEDHLKEITNFLESNFELDFGAFISEIEAERALKTKSIKKVEP